MMPEPNEVVFQINESLFQQLVEWQEKMESGEISLPEEAEIERSPQPEKDNRETGASDFSK